MSTRNEGTDPNDSDEPATQGFVRQELTKRFADFKAVFSSEVDAKLEDLKADILHHFDASVEIITEELKGANADEISLIRDQQLPDHAACVRELRRHIPPAVLGELALLAPAVACSYA